MKIRVLQKHESTYPNPIEFVEGDNLALGKIDPDYPGWIQVTTRDGNTGWAPLKYIARDTDMELGKAITHYTAVELDVAPGEGLDVIKELDGWYWCRNELNRLGWVPVAIGEVAD